MAEDKLYTQFTVLIPVRDLSEKQREKAEHALKERLAVKRSWKVERPYEPGEENGR